MARSTTRLENQCYTKAFVEFYKHAAFLVSRVGRVCRTVACGVWVLDSRVTFWKTLSIASGRRHIPYYAFSFQFRTLSQHSMMDYGWIDSRSDLKDLIS